MTCWCVGLWCWRGRVPAAACRPRPLHLLVLLPNAARCCHRALRFGCMRRCGHSSLQLQLGPGPLFLCQLHCARVRSADAVRRRTQWFSVQGGRRRAVCAACVEAQAHSSIQGCAYMYMDENILQLDLPQLPYARSAADPCCAS